MKPSTWLWLSPVTTRRWWRCKVKMPVRNSPSRRVSSSRATACWILGPSTSPATWTAAIITARLRSVAPWQPTQRPVAPWAPSPPSGSPKRTAVRAPRGTSLSQPHGTACLRAVSHIFNLKTDVDLYCGRMCVCVMLLTLHSRCTVM